MWRHDTKLRPGLRMDGAYPVEFNGNQYAHVATLRAGVTGKAKKDDVAGS